MPFIPESVKKLRRREGLPSKLISIHKLAKSLTEFARDNSLERLFSSCTYQTISNWENGITIPHIGTVDVLYMYSSSKGYNDLEFYAKPSEE